MINVVLVQTGGDGNSHLKSVVDGTTLHEFLRDFASETDEKFRVTLLRGGTAYGQGADQPHPLLDDMVLLDMDKITTTPKNLGGAN